MISPDKIFNILPIFAYLNEYWFNSINLIYTRFIKVNRALDENIIDWLAAWCLLNVQSKFKETIIIAKKWAILISFYETHVMILLSINDIPFFDKDSIKKAIIHLNVTHLSSPKKMIFTN